MRARVAAFLAGLGMVLTGPLQAEVTAREPWIREAPPAAEALAGYLELENSGDEARVLIGGESPEFGRIEVHRTEHDEGVMRMRPLDGVDVPAGERVRFETGGIHLMLMRPKRRFQEGDTVPVTLQFENGDELEVEFSVRRGSR